MKKLLFLLIASGGAASAIAQQSAHRPYTADSLMSRWVIDVNLLGGLASQEFTTASTAADYPGALNMNTGNLKYKDGYALGGDAQLGFFFGHKRHFGIGTGVLLMQQHGDAYLDNYYAQYKATDGAGNIYRQVVTGHDIRESITSTNINIPVVLKYKNRFSKHWGFTADAGALVNVQMKNAYTTHGTFDYEAVYKFVQNSDGGTTSVYDNSATPSANDWLITKAEFLRNNPNGNYQDYVNTKRALGYSVGQTITPATRNGKTSYVAGSVGLLIQPSISYYLSDHVALNFGAYYMYQPFKNNPETGYRVTDGVGKYSSVLNSVTESTNQSYGINIGARFFLGRKQAPLVITSIDYISPSKCGLCDGSMAIKGLTPNQPVTVDYSLNGGQPGKYATTVQPDGQARIPNLCAGSYTGISATIKRRNAKGEAVTLTDPAITFSTQTTNPAAQGSCDGAVTFKGFIAGTAVAINYKLNGNSQTAFAGIVNPDNSVTISGLCEGTYTGIVASVNKCTANGADFTLAAPEPVKPPVAAPVPVVMKADISTPILFDLNMTFVHADAYSELDEAAKELNENKGSYLLIDGHADASGIEAKNVGLSYRRANSVKQQLVQRGISPARLRTRGHGSSIPAATNNTAEGRQQNRRSMMKLVTKGK
jgi:outer membrane protein OmpA-like peptidoglycan-associated protein